MDEVVPYEDRLRADPWFMLEEVGAFLDGTDRLVRTVRRAAARLDWLRVPYAFAGDLALSVHGRRCVTVERVHLLVSDATLRAIHDERDGFGWVVPPGGGLLDVETGVRLAFALAGERVESAVLPDPAAVTVEVSGVRCVDLPTAIAHKIALGITTRRLRHLGDVQDTIRELALPVSFADRLDPSVRVRFLELHVEPDPDR